MFTDGFLLVVLLLVPATVPRVLVVPDDAERLLIFTLPLFDVEVRVVYVFRLEVDVLRAAVPRELLLVVASTSERELLVLYVFRVAVFLLELVPEPLLT